MNGFITVREFIKLRKEILEAYGDYAERAESYRMHVAMNGEQSNDILKVLYEAVGSELPKMPEWPEALQGITEEEIQSLR
jgi:hypothetical protein